MDLSFCIELILKIGIILFLIGSTIIVIIMGMVLLLTVGVNLLSKFEIK